MEDSAGPSWNVQALLVLWLACAVATRRPSMPGCRAKYLQPLREQGEDPGIVAMRTSLIRPRSRNIIPASRPLKHAILFPQHIWLADRLIPIAFRYARQLPWTRVP